MLPTTQEYKISLMIGEDSFRTLKDVEVIPNPNYPAEPWFSTGGLAIVFKIKVKEKLYALKCFYTEANERQERLGFISSYLKQHSSAYFVDFTYLDDELWVETAHGGGGYPVVLMEWIEGKTFDNYLEGVCKRNDKIALKNLYFQFCNLAWWLQQQPIAHGDLKHDNLIVTTEGKLKLIDYDGMFVPALVGRKANELGSPCYQHPQRDSYFFNKDLDDFSLLILQITLLALQHEPSLFAKHYNGDGILLKDTDYRNFSGSSIKTILWQLPEVKLPLLLSQVQANLSQSKAIDLMPLIQDVEWINWLISGQKDSKLNLERQRLKELVLGDERWCELFIRQISANYPITDELMENYEVILDWGLLKENTSVFLSEKSIDKFKDIWNWEELSRKKHLPWSLNLIEKYKDKWVWDSLIKYNEHTFILSLIENYQNKWDWEKLSYNNAIPWSLELIEKYKDKWNWNTLSGNEKLPWSLELIEKYKDKWNWNTLSGNKKLPWSSELILEYITKWNWSVLSNSEAIRWQSDIINLFNQEWDWEKLSYNNAIPWSLELIEKYQDKWHWSVLSINEKLPWSLELIEKYNDKWNWSELSYNQTISWSIDLIEKYKHRFDWYSLSGNGKLPWSIELIEKYQDKWNYGGLIFNKTIHWSIYLIEKCHEKLGFQLFFIFISERRDITWSIELIEKYEDRWDWDILSRNNSLPWSVELLEKFKHKWNWGMLVCYIHFFREYHSFELIERYKNYWNWEILSRYTAFPNSEQLVEIYKNKWNFHCLSLNESLPWSFKLVEQYKDKWDWNDLGGVIYPYIIEPILDDFFINDVLYCLYNATQKQSKNIDDDSLPFGYLYDFDPDDDLPF